MDTSGVKQSDTFKYVAHVLEKPCQRNTDNMPNYYDTPKYVVCVLGGVVPKTDIRLPESRSHRQMVAPQDLKMLVFV